MKTDLESRNIAIFLSSTFDDMGDERNEINKAIKSLSKEVKKRGINIRLVDLRLGIEKTESEESLYNEKVIRLCLEAVENCKPYFIGLLGKRYGWIPNKDEVEFDKNMFSDAHFALVQKALNEGKSVTEMEMILGALEAEGENAFVYFLDDNVEEISFESYRKRQLYDNKEREEPLSEERIVEKYYNEFQENDEKQEKLSSLKEKLRKSVGVQVGIYGNLNSLRNLVLSDLNCFIDQKFPINISELEQEELIFKNYLKNRESTYIKRLDLEKKIIQYIKGKSLKPLLITGKSGMGKSTLIAKVHNRFMNKKIIIFSYYIGYTSIHNSLSDIILDIMKNLKQNKKDIYEEMIIPDDVEEMKSVFADWLNSLNEKCLIVIDGINQLYDNDNYSWLPYNLPEHVKVIVSSADENDEVINKIASRFNENLNRLVVKGLSKLEQKELIKQEYNNKHGKYEMNTEMENQLISENELSRNPLYIETLINELVYYGKYDNIKHFINQYKVDHNNNGVYDMCDVYIIALRRRLKEFNKFPVLELYSLLTVTVTGLSEEEIQEILENHYHIAISNLELRIIIGSLDEYLIEFGELLKWKHNYLKKAIQFIVSENYLKDASIAIANFMKGSVIDTKDNRKFTELIQQHIFRADNKEIIGLLKQLQVFKNYHSHDYYTTVLLNMDETDEVLLTLFDFYKNNMEIEGIHLLGTFLLFNGYEDKALILREIEYDYDKNNFGLNHPTTLISLSNLACMYMMLKKYEQALEPNEICYEKSKEILGDNHPDTLISLNNLGYTYKGLGDVESALICLETCYKKRKKTLGPIHLDTIGSLDQLGNFYKELCNYKKAVKCFRKCYKNRKKVLGVDHPDTIISLNKLNNIIN